MDDNQRLSAALAFATEKHRGQVRIGGEPYISHPVAVQKLVAQEGYDMDYQITALFHDLLEDTDATEEEILHFGNARVLRAVKCLTKEEGYQMGEYIATIRENPVAFVVKAADRLHNLQSALVAPLDFRRKYILETVDWYLDFSSEIPKAVKALAESLPFPLSELEFLYEPIDNWKL